MKQAWMFIKSLLANKRTRAIAVLILWFFFFVFVQAFITANKSNPQLEPKFTGWDAFERIDSYSFEITMNEKVSAIHDKGFVIIYNDIQYNQDTLPLELEDYYLSFWNPSNIRKIVEKATLVSTNYIENKDIYELKEDSYPLIPWENIENITIEVYKKDDTFYKIIMDQKDIPFHLEWKAE